MTSVNAIQARASAAALAVAVITIGLLPSVASAVPVLSPAYSSRLVKDCVDNGHGGCSLSNWDVGPGTTTSANGKGSVSAFGGPGSPSVTVHASSAASTSTLAQGATHYFWMVVGADPDDHSIVPIWFSTSMSVSASAGEASSGIGAALIYGGGGVGTFRNEVVAAACSGSGGLDCHDAYGNPYASSAGFSGSISYSAFAGTEGDVNLLGTATALADCAGAGGILGLGGCGGTEATVNVFVDPYIFIDPAFLASHPGYSIIVSEGMSNGPAAVAVPEPETYTMLLTGLAVLGFTTRRRKQSRPMQPALGETTRAALWCGGPSNTMCA